MPSDLPSGMYAEAYAAVSLKTTATKFPVNLEPVSNSTLKVFPSRIILVVEAITETEPEKATDCGCEALGDFHEQKRVLEEFSYCSLIRTSDPEIKAYTIEEDEEVSLEDFINVSPVIKKPILDLFAR